jgi:hypothetical protein
MGENSIILGDYLVEINKYSVIIGDFPTLLHDSSCFLCTILCKVHGRHHVDCDGDGEVCYLLPMRADFTLPIQMRDSLKEGHFQYVTTQTDSIATDVYVLPMSKADEKHPGMEWDKTWSYRKLDFHSRFKMQSRSALLSRQDLTHSKLSKSGVAFGTIRDWIAKCETGHRFCDSCLLSKQQGRFSERNDVRQVSEAHPIRCIESAPTDLSISLQVIVTSV